MPVLPLGNKETVIEARGQLDSFVESQPHIFRENVKFGVIYKVVFGNLIPMEKWNHFRQGLRGLDGFVGMGRDRLVVDHPLDPNKVTSVFHETKSWLFLHEARAINGMLSTMFPHNFPYISAHFGYNNFYAEEADQPADVLTGFVTDKKIGNSPVGVNRRLGFLGGYIYDYDNFTLEYEGDKPQEVKYPFRNVFRILKRIDFPIEVLDLSPSPENFILGKDGGEYFIDTVVGPSFSPFSRGGFLWKGGPLLQNIGKAREEGVINISDSQFNSLQKNSALLE